MFLRYIQQIRLRMLNMVTVEEVADLIAVLRASNNDLYDALIAKNKTVIRLADITDRARIDARHARSQANKFACLALLGFGLIAIEAQALTLYLLPR